MFSCRTGKWALLGIKTLFKDLQKCEKNTYYLQMDIKSFFVSIDKEFFLNPLK